ncbi:MAG: type II secretion system F family protein [Patescibacteria group bacterium]
MKFKYTARSTAGETAHGQMEAESEIELKNMLAEQNLSLEDVATVTEPVIRQQVKYGLFQKISVVDKIFFAQNLQVMIRAGLPMAAALKTLIDQTENKLLKKILNDINDHVVRGITLSDALARHPKVFSELFVNMIRAGEKSGKLEEVLGQVTVQLRKNHALIAKVRGALTYPIIVIIAMIGIGIGMIVFVIPKITDIFSEVNATLPLPTRILIGLSNFIINNGLLVTLGVIILIWLFMRFIKSKRGRHLWHRLLLKLPVLNSILKKINLASFCRTFSSLIKTDIPIVQAFKITASTINNVIYREAIDNMGDQVRQGVQIASILPQYPMLFPPLVVQMITVGENTGSLDKLLEELAGFYEEEVDQTMSTLSTIIEPLLMIILGIGVGSMAVAIILPLYSLTQSI